MDAILDWTDSDAARRRAVKACSEEAVKKKENLNGIRRLRVEGCQNGP
jgi:hypothetical protein